VKEPTVHVHTETSVPQTPSPIHLSPAAAELAEEPRISAIDTIADVSSESPQETNDTDTASDPSESFREENPTVTDPPQRIATETAGSSAGIPLSKLNAEDLLLIGLILLLTAEGEDASELPVLLALLLAYRPSENK
jgi:hypothetical protein